jgi:2-amino-4-hydroxy-6-hydroxymethyldihydropteridine diphosphokinase
MPLDLLSQLKMIERRLGRVKSEELNAPRPIDLDILFYDDIVIMSGKTLSIPHPKIAERTFVLKPLAEIAPDLVHPRLNRNVKELLESLQPHEGSQRFQSA